MGFERATTLKFALMFSKFDDLRDLNCLKLQASYEIRHRDCQEHQAEACDGNC